VEILERPGRRTTADARWCSERPMLAAADRRISVVAIWVGFVEKRFTRSRFTLGHGIN
jgi:hypothetical protein